MSEAVEMYRAMKEADRLSSPADEVLRKIIEAVDILNQGVGMQRVGGLDSANKVGTLLNEAWLALGEPEDE